MFRDFHQTRKAGIPDRRRGGLILKIRNRDSFRPFVKWGIVNWKIIPFTIPIPPKCAKNGQGIGIVILYESESWFFMNGNRPTSSPRPVSVIFWTNTTVKPSPWPSWLRWQQFHQTFTYWSVSGLEVARFIKIRNRDSFCLFVKWKIGNQIPFLFLLRFLWFQFRFQFHQNVPRNRNRDS